MKKTTILLLSALMVLSCTGNKTNESSDSTDSVAVSSADTVTVEEEVNTPAAEDVIKEQIEANYNAALKAGNMDASIKKYCSAAFISAYDKYNKSIEGEIGDIDYDIWLQAQDEDKPSATVEKVSMIDDSKAEVKVKITNFGENTSITLIVVKENDEWKIDDFINSSGKIRKILEK